MWHDEFVQDGLILPKGIDVIYTPVQLPLPSVEFYGLEESMAYHVGCDHEYINVGFTSITEVCRKCHKEKN